MSDDQNKLAYEQLIYQINNLLIKDKGKKLICMVYMRL